MECKGSIPIRIQGPMFNPNQKFLLVQKLKLATKGFTLGVKGGKEKIFLMALYMLNFNGLVLAQRWKKGYH